jgi:CheY-like chemotaxis protein
MATGYSQQKYQCFIWMKPVRCSVRIDPSGNLFDKRKEIKRLKFSIWGNMKKQKIPIGEPHPFEASRNETKIKKIRVLLADDHLIMRRGIRVLINKEDDLLVVAEAGNGKEAVTRVHETSPHVIIMDFNMPVMNGLEATKEILLAKPAIKIIGLSLNNHDYARQCMLDVGASAYLTKDEVFDRLCATIRSVVRGPKDKAI